MTRTRRECLGVLGSIGAVTLAGCTGSDSDAGQGDTTTETETTTTTADSMSGATVQVRSHDEYGDILVDGDGMTLYMFDSDTQGSGESTCAGSCLDNWPPLSGDSVDAESSVSAELTTFERSDGQMQVAANGWPLYYFASDESPGDAKGQGVGDVWWVLDPAGTPLTGASDATTTTTSEGGGDDGDDDYY